MKIEFLKWDTDFFGIKIGRLVLHPEDKFDSILFEEEANINKYDLVYVFSLQKLMEIENENKAILDLVDIQITMSKPFLKLDYNDEAYEFRTQLTDVEKDECYKIAEETSIYSRFYHEKLIGPEMAKKLYRKWIDNALNKSFSDGLLISKSSNIITGIHVVKTDSINEIGHCSLIGVNSLYRGQNLGHDLWEQASNYWANETNIETLNVPFSLNNIGSFNFHLKMGFNKIEEVKYIYHFRNKNSTI